MDSRFETKARAGLSAPLRPAVVLLMAAALSALLAMTAAPGNAQAAQVAATGAAEAQAVQVAATGAAAAQEAPLPALSAQSDDLATSDAAAISKKAAKNAKALVKKAKATKGSDKSKLKKIYAYIATDRKWKGAFSFDSYLNFWMKARNTGNAKYYASAAGPKTMKGNYKKYAIDAFKTKKASCYHYAALFAVAAKQALGSKAKVKVAVGTVKQGDGTLNPHHSWVEVKLGKTTYVYDTQQGNNHSKYVSKKKHGFGKFCGSKKSAMKSRYKNYKGAKYCTVKL